MTKENAKDPKSKMVSQMLAFKKAGNYSKLRSAFKTLKDSDLLPNERDQIAEILASTEPSPLVFWIGVGSVALAMATALWLTH